jgi:hypothetical protein
VKTFTVYIFAAAMLLPFAWPHSMQLCAQTADRPPREIGKFGRLNEDSLITRATATPDTVMRPGKSTTVALLSSMILPGSGQIYNGAYWKAPIVWGAGYYLYSVYRRQNSLYREHRDLYAASIDTTAPNGNGQEKLLRDFYKGQRDTFGWYMAFAYLVTLLDAYVDASLYGFEVSPTLQTTSNIHWIGVSVRF